MQTSWYQKPMASERLVNFCSKHPKRIILNTVTNSVSRVISDIEYIEESAFPWTRLLNSTIILVYIETKKKSEIKYTNRCSTFLGLSEIFSNSKFFEGYSYSLDKKNFKHISQNIYKPKMKDWRNGYVDTRTNKVVQLIERFM